MATRLSKVVLVFSLSLFALLVGANNIFDYGVNFAFVQHVLLMDTVFPDNKLMWRAVETLWLQHLGYWLIIFSELAVGILGFWGGVKLWKARHNATMFNQQKTCAIMAMTLAILLWFTGFIVIAGEWFLMWQSADWNATQGAFRFAVVFMLGLIFLCQEDLAKGHA